MKHPDRLVHPSLIAGSFARCLARRIPMVSLVAAAVALAVTVAWADERYTLGRYVPNDVLLYVGERQNPERAFSDEYWDDVLQVLKASGIHEDVVSLIAEIAKPTGEQSAEIERLKKRVSQLLAGVDWEKLTSGESAFLERLGPSLHVSQGQPKVVMTSLVWLAAGSPEGARSNFNGLTDILRAIAEEVNRATDSQAFVVEESTYSGAQLASLNMLCAVPEAPPFPLSVALRDNVILIALREDLLADVLQLMDGSSGKTPLASDPRFQAGVAELPTAEDQLVYFDMQALLKPLTELKRTVFELMAQPGDHYKNTGINAEASKINYQALSAYQGGDYQQALSLTQKAYELDKEDSVILYNLACFHALAGNRDEALKWLPLAVDAGFYAPSRIASDSDLKSLRDAPAYAEALANAAAKARALAAKDVIPYAAQSGEVKRLRLEIRQAQDEKNYEHALQLNEQALAIDEKDPELLYLKASLHCRLGQHKEAFESLKRAILGGFYCPERISKDATWNSVREDKEYDALLATAADLAGEYNLQQKTAKTLLVRGLLDRSLDAAGVMDYSVTAMSTRDHCEWTDSIMVLAPGAEQTAVYPLIRSQEPQANLDQFLPVETESFYIHSGVKPKALFDFIEDSVRAGGPLGEDLMQKLQQLQGSLGVDLRRDVFELLTGTSISVTLDDDRGTVTMIGVTDEKAAFERVQNAVTSLPKLIAGLVKAQPAMGGLAALNVTSKPVEHEQLEGFHALSMPFSPEPIAVWGASDGYLVFGSSADAIAVCLAAAHGEHPRFRDDESSMKEALLPEGPLVSASLSDMRANSEEIAKGMATASMMSAMFTAGIGDPKARTVVTRTMGMLTKLAPVVSSIDFYKSSASHTTFDGKRWYTRAVTRYLTPEERKARRQPRKEPLP